MKWILQVIFESVRDAFPDTSIWLEFEENQIVFCYGTETYSLTLKREEK